MFCPNCGAENRVEQNFCRSCGLKLDAISQAVADQFPSKEYTELQRRKELFEKLGLFSLSAAGLIGLGFLLFTAAYYKLILFGPDVLFWSSAGALIGFLLLSVFFFSYPKLFMKFKKLDPRQSLPDEPTISASTNKLLEDKPFEPIPSVTEHSTELLRAPEKIPRSK